MNTRRTPKCEDLGAQRCIHLDPECRYRALSELGDYDVIRNKQVSRQRAGDDAYEFSIAVEVN